MFDYLVDHALKNVWCTPDQDTQMILQPARITPINGSENYVKVAMESINLPTKRERYHVYQIGQMHPKLMGLFPERNTWRTLAHVCELENLMVDLYVKSGIQFPRVESWLLVTYDKNVLIAVKEQKRIAADLNNEPLFVRFYSNAYFNSLRSDPAADMIVVRGKATTTTDELLAVQRKYEEYRNLPGATFAFVNGVRHNGISLVNASVGDVVEFVYDSTVMQTIEIPISSLQTFDSILDEKRKYLVHPAKESDEGSIEYRDDIDIYLIRRTGATYKGVYYHKNQEDAVRMVTHRDYALPVAYVYGYTEDNPSLGNVGNMSLLIHIRKSGYDRPLVNEHNRIRELYKLSDTELMKALLGVDSVVSIWRADSLEQSAYTQIMRSNGTSVSREMVQNAYGYNAISKLIADTPQAVGDLSGPDGVGLPYGLRLNATVYEYDRNGVLLGYHYHEQGEEYFPVNPDCKLVEVLVGRGQKKMTTTFGPASSSLIPDYNYRFYLSPVIRGVATEEWQDVTGGTQYSVQNNVVTWFIDQTKWYPQVKGDYDFLAYDLELQYEDEILQFTITAEETQYGVTVVRPLSLPVGKLDLWLNGHPLIENLDYYVDWPRVVIVNKQHLVEGQLQKITVRGTGFCNPDLSRETPAEVGFVRNGLLSRNNRFNLRDDKVMRFVVEGALLRKEDLLFSEDDNGLRVAGVRNGAPYVLDDIIVPLRGLTNSDTYTLRARSKEVDAMIEDYLTLKVPEPDISDLNYLERLYNVYSPFCSKLIHDLQNGFLSGGEIEGHYSEYTIRQWLQPYEWLLEYDPVRRGVDQNYVSIHPHNRYVVLELNIYQYTFMERVIKLYLADKVDLTHFVRMRIL